MIPTLIIDDFFSDPDKILEFEKTIKYDHSTDGRWPGVRTAPLVSVDPEFNSYFCERLLRNFYTDLNQTEFEMHVGFQKINPMHEDQYHIKNRGWIHYDLSSHFGGIVYLNKNPEKDTGTNLYKETTGYYYARPECLEVKERFYRGESVSDDEYAQAFNALHESFELSVKVEPVYNRLLCFNNTVAHGVETYGKSQTRLTLAFFGRVAGQVNPPLYRYP